MLFVKIAAGLCFLIAFVIWQFSGCRHKRAQQGRSGRYCNDCKKYIKGFDRE
jgi:hypothetical protein